MSLCSSRSLFISLACALIIPFFAAKECSERCYEDNTCIDYYMKCTGIKDCEHGSDESYPRCKLQLSSMYFSPNEFHCVSGPVMNIGTYCNGVSECPDGSDELVQLCQPGNETLLIEKLQGKCLK